MRKNISIAIVGLGKIGSRFLDKLVDFEGKGIHIVGVAEKNQDSYGIKKAIEHNITIFADAQGVINRIDDIDVIFDLSGHDATKRTLRLAMMNASNKGTVLLQEVTAHLIWNLITDEDIMELPDESITPID